jgi:N-hydroxyarylamine O-acetyltransferase
MVAFIAATTIRNRYHEGMNLGLFFERIGYTGSLEPTLNTLRSIHRAYLLSVPYENYDIHLGRTVPLSVARAFDKIVGQKRGGWCFEMNGLLGWALRELGFDAWHASAAVNRAARGNLANDNHLIILVRLEGELWLCDAGFGNGLLEPIPLRAGEHQQDWMHLRLEQHGSTWVFHPDARASTISFEFTLAPRELESFQTRCTWLQTSKESGFVQSTVCIKHHLGGLLVLRGAVLTDTRGDTEEKTVLESAEQFAYTLRERFDLEFPETAQLWGKIWTRHQEWVEAQKTPTIIS